MDLMTSIASLLDQALQLSGKERVQLAGELLRTLDPPGDDLPYEEWCRVWREEIDIRLAAADRGEIDPRPWPDVLDEIAKSEGS